MAETITDLTGYTWTANATLTTPTFEFTNGKKSFSINWSIKEYPEKESLVLYKNIKLLLESYKSAGYVTSYTITSGDIENLFVIDGLYYDITLIDFIYSSSNATGTVTIGSQFEPYIPAGTYPLTVEQGWHTGYPYSNIITFTGGTDATNTELIAWLQANGTLTKSSTQKLEAPSIVGIIANTYESWTLSIENNNAINVTCNYTYGSQSDTDPIEPSTQGQIGRAWTSGQTSIVVTMYFSADGYENSDSITYTITRPLAAPIITISENTTSKLILNVQNPTANPTVSCYLTGGTTKLFDLNSGASNTHTWLWGDSITSRTISFTFTADGYEDSKNSITVNKPSTIDRNKYRSSNDFTPTMPTSELTQDIVFTSNNIEFSGMRITSDTLYYVKSDGTEVEVYNTSTKWTGNTEYITILVETDQDMSVAFKTFFNTLYKTIDNFEYTLKIKGNETYTIKLNLGGTTYEIK